MPDAPIFWLKPITGVEQPCPGIYPQIYQHPPAPHPRVGWCGGPRPSAWSAVYPGVVGGRGLSLGGGGGGSGDGVSDDGTVFDLELDSRAYTEGAGEELLGEQVLDLVLDDTP